MSRYWPELSAAERHVKLRTIWARIVEAMERRIAGVAAALPVPAPGIRGWRLKAYEDTGRRRLRRRRHRLLERHGPGIWGRKRRDLGSLRRGGWMRALAGLG